MAKYEIFFKRNIVESFPIYIEAESEDEATDKAKAIIDEDEHDFSAASDMAYYNWTICKIEKVKENGNI